MPQYLSLSLYVLCTFHVQYLMLCYTTSSSRKTHNDPSTLSHLPFLPAPCSCAELMRMAAALEHVQGFLLNL
jgi:hypothetical protein